MFVLKVINNESKTLTHHEIIDRIAEQTVLMITQVCTESISSLEFTVVKCLIYLSISVHLLLLCRCMDLNKGILFKKIRNHPQPLKLHQHITIFHKFS